MSQLAPRGAALVAAPLPDTGTLSVDAPSASASAAMAAAATATATPTASNVRGDAMTPSPAADAVATEAKTAGADAANDAAPAPAAANTVRASAAGTAALDTTGAASAIAATPTSAPAAPAVSIGAPAAANKQITTAHLANPARAPSPATAGSIGGAVLALVLVVGLILLLAWLAKRMPGLGGASSNPALRIVGSLALGPRERLVVVAVGDTQLLLGVGAGGTRTLHTLTQPLPATTAATPAFAQLLAQHFGKKA